MEDLVECMAHIVDLAAACETTPNGPSLLHSLLSAEDASFSAPSHQAVGVERQAQGLEYAGHQGPVLAGAANTSEVPIRDRCSF